MNFGFLKKLGALFKTVRASAPRLQAAGATNNSAIDRNVPGGVMYHTLTLHSNTGAIAGAPSAQTVDAKIQDSADGSTGWADYIPPGQATVAAIAQITAANAEAEVDVDLSGAKRFVRVVETVGFTGGTSPTIGLASTVILGGADRLPV